MFYSKMIPYSLERVKQQYAPAFISNNFSLQFKVLANWSASCEPDKERKDNLFKKKRPLPSRPPNPDNAPSKYSCFYYSQRLLNPQHTQDSDLPQDTPTQGLKTSLLFDTTGGRLFPEDFTNQFSRHQWVFTLTDSCRICAWCSDS